MSGLCRTCRHQQVVANTRGSTFSLCARHRTEPERFPKYPRLPVLSCPGWQRGEEANSPATEEAAG